ncbi:MAG: LysR family transcriptional regulator [Rhodobiaceae bacterium]|nr:LysR family transcriptional regulator [Rhodobiaceae bacterium]MCC0012077.1 LysR family transcriptional regulator [Rhodobiaceae bacterium]MCC0061007.1 LysR family transcriptional regulator [Rhodobiaceae bacterium]
MDWGDLQVLAVFAREGSTAATARAIGSDETTVVRRLRRLGEVLGSEVIAKVDRRYQLTAAGLQASRHAGDMALAAQALSGDVAGLDQPAGVVRLTGLRAILDLIVIPRYAELRKRFPDISIDFIADARNLDLARGEADIAVRLALPTGPDIYGRKLADMTFAAYTRAGSDTSCPLHWLTYTEALGVLPEAQWLAAHVPPQHVVARCNSIEGLAALAVNGHGGVMLPCFFGDASASLERIAVPPFGPEACLSREVWTAVHESQRRVPCVRAVIDWLVTIFSAGIN